MRTLFSNGNLILGYLKGVDTFKPQETSKSPPILGLLYYFFIIFFPVFSHFWGWLGRSEQSWKIPGASNNVVVLVISFKIA